MDGQLSWAPGVCRWTRVPLRGLAKQTLDFDPATAALGAAVTAIGGMLPDLDSDSGVPVRETFGLAAAVVPLFLMPRLLNSNLSHEEILLFLLGVYAVIRYGLSQLFKRITVHRGMFHSIPALFVAGLCSYLALGGESLRDRIFLASGVMIGFLSHLMLDEICSVDFQGLTIKLKSSAGSAMKFVSKSAVATAVCYLILAGLAYLALRDFEAETGRQILPWPQPSEAMPAAIRGP